MKQHAWALFAVLAAAAGGAAAQAVVTDEVVVVPAPPTPAVVVPAAPVTTYRYTGEPGAVPKSRAQVQAEGTAAMHGGGATRGEALVTRNRPHGGAVNADAPSTGAGAGNTNGINGWSNGPSGDGG